MAFSYINKQGDVERVFGLLQDISDDVTNNEKINALQDRLDATFSFFPFPVSVTTESFTFIYTNPALQKYSGYTAEEFIGNNVSMIKPEDEAKESFALLESLRKGEIDTISAVRKLLHKNGDVSQVYVRAKKLPQTAEEAPTWLHINIPLDRPIVIDAAGKEVRIASQKIL